jgi:ligand-binding sensor domain-containing protein
MTNQFIKAILVLSLAILISCDKEDTSIESEVWTTFTAEDGLAGDCVFAMTIDLMNNKWFATNLGPCALDEANNWHNHASWDELPQCTYSVAVDQQNNKWFGTLNGVFKFDGLNWTSFTTADGLVNDQVSSVVVDNKDIKWVGTAHGVSKFNDTTWTSYTSSNGLTGEYIHGIAVDHNNFKWFNTSDGILRFTNFAWSKKYDFSCFGISADKKGNIWMSSRPGEIMEYDHGWNTITSENELITEQVSCMAFDSQGNVWIGTLGGGVVKFDGTNWTNYTTIDGLANDNVNAIIIDDKDTKWFATSDGVSKLGKF